jgi:hypothetical protein
MTGSVPFPDFVGELAEVAPKIGSMTGYPFGDVLQRE